MHNFLTCIITYLSISKYIITLYIYIYIYIYKYIYISLNFKQRNQFKKVKTKKELNNKVNSKMKKQICFYF